MFDLYKRILPSYLNEHIIISNIHSRNTRYANSNVIFQKYKRQTEAGRTFVSIVYIYVFSIRRATLWNMLINLYYYYYYYFSVTSTRLGNSLPLTVRKALTCFKKNNSFSILTFNVYSSNVRTCSRGMLSTLRGTVQECLET